MAIHTISGATHNFAVKIDSVLMRLCIYCLVLCVQFAACLPSALAQSKPVKVAIIIDDIGFQKADPMLIKLPYALTFAVMPFTPNGAEMAALAATRGKEVILHMPMEAVALNHLLGKGALRQSMSRSEVEQALNQALKQVPQAVGVNNHMGSLYTSLAEPMDWTMQLMAARGLYFIDSKTTGRSQVEKYSKLHQVKSRSRDVFLDNDKSYKAIDKQFKHLITIAKQHGSAIAIGHPYPETYQYLRKNLQRLQREGIHLVPASQLLDLPGAPYVASQHTPKPAKTPSKQPPQVKVEETKTVAVTNTTENKKQHAQDAKTEQPELHEQVQVLSAETEVQPLELLPWRLPLRIDLHGFAAPSPATPIHTQIADFWPIPAPEEVPIVLLPAVGVIQY